jgi:hypothetical protein
VIVTGPTISYFPNGALRTKSRDEMIGRFLSGPYAVFIDVAQKSTKIWVAEFANPDSAILHHPGRDKNSTGDAITANIW